MVLMLLGNAGIVTVVSSLVLAFMHADETTWLGSTWTRVVILAAGLFLLWRLANSRWVDDQLSRLIEWALTRFTKLNVQDLVGLLHLAKDYEVAEMSVDEGEWLANRRLMDLRLGDEGVLVLGIERANGSYLGAPKGEVELEIGDKLLVYGPESGLVELDDRPAGPDGIAAHETAVIRQQGRERMEQQRMNTGD